MSLHLLPLLLRTPAREGDPGAVRNLPTPQGAKLGAGIADIVERNAERVARQNPDLPAMCADCLCRRGTVPNQCGPSLLHLANCLYTHEPFYCHMGVPDGEESTRVCGGYARLAAATGLTSIPKEQA